MHWNASLIIFSVIPPRFVQSTRTPVKPVITLLVRLSPAGPFEVLDTTGPRVGHVKDAIIAKFKQLEDAKADQLVLYLLDGSSSRTPLDPSLTLAEAGIHDGTKLAVEIPVGMWAVIVGCSLRRFEPRMLQARMVFVNACSATSRFVRLSIRVSCATIRSAATKRCHCGRGL